MPELCDRHPVPASLWRRAVCLPALLYRLNQLLVAHHVREIIAREAHIGAIHFPSGTPAFFLQSGPHSLAFPSTAGTLLAFSSTAGHTLLSFPSTSGRTLLAFPSSLGPSLHPHRGLLSAPVTQYFLPLGYSFVVPPDLPQVLSSSQHKSKLNHLHWNYSSTGIHSAFFFYIHQIFLRPVGTNILKLYSETFAPTKFSSIKRLEIFHVSLIDNFLISFHRT